MGNCIDFIPIFFIVLVVILILLSLAFKIKERYKMLNKWNKKSSGF